MTTPAKMLNRFLELLETSPYPLLTDGAMGTLLNMRGQTFEQSFPELNLTNPALIAGIHREYIDAGAQILKTNTFSANRYKLAEHGLDPQVAEINRAGVDLARRVALASFKDVFIAGDVGPLGVRLAPFGRVQPHEARAAFREQIHALAEAGADLILIETVSDLYEMREAIAAAREACALPVVACITFTRDDRTLLGDSPQKVARALVEYGADVIGPNCSGGPAQLLRILRQMRAVAPDAKFIVMPNAGWPEQVGGKILYPAGPDYFGQYASEFCELGVRMVGGCCGTTPKHISVMARALQETCPPAPVNGFAVWAEREEEDATPREQPTQLAQKLSAGKFVVAVEMDPPRGLSTHKLLAGAQLLADAGADVIDVADSPMARMRMSPWAVCNLIQTRANTETTLHFPTRGRNLLRIQGDLLAAHALNIRNVFVVMGDPTSIGDYPEAMDNYDLVPSGLIKLIKQNFNAGLDHAGAKIGLPTSFFVGCALNLTPADFDRESKNLRRKLEAGADFILTQPVYESEPARRFLAFYAEKYGALPVPLLVGVLPLYGVRHAAFLHNEVPGISIPDGVRARLEAAGDDSPHEGVRIAAELVTEMRDWAQGIYVMPQFSRYDLAAALIEQVRVQE